MGVLFTAANAQQSTTGLPDASFQNTAQVVIGAGLVANFPAGWAAFVDWHTLVGLSNFYIHTLI